MTNKNNNLVCQGILVTDYGRAKFVVPNQITTVNIENASFDPIDLKMDPPENTDLEGVDATVAYIFYDSPRNILKRIVDVLLKEEETDR